MKNLTDRQRQVLDYIAQFAEQNGYPPTVREIGENFGISLRAVQDHIGALQKKGFLSQSQKRSRSIVVLKDMRPSSNVLAKVPLLGHVVPGRPLVSEENIEEYVSCASPLVQAGKSYFALHIYGPSMINAGILDGDIALIEQCDTALEGEIVVAVIEDSVLLRRFVRENNRILLKSENPDYPPVYTQDVRVAGRLAGILRTYSR